MSILALTEAEAKIKYQADFKRCLIECDVDGLMALHKYVLPHLPPARNREEALFQLHLARTKVTTIPKKLRAYSADWLKERGWDVRLENEHIRDWEFRMDKEAKAEKNPEQKIVSAVGASANAQRNMPGLQPVIQTAMEDAIKSCHAEGITDDNVIRQRMQEYRGKARAGYEEMVRKAIAADQAPAAEKK